MAERILTGMVQWASELGCHAALSQLCRVSIPDAKDNPRSIHEWMRH
ncbi:hypothetical protein [Salmonella enterica]